MKIQVLQDGSGRPTGVYMPMEDWVLIKGNYPDVEDLMGELPHREKDLIDKRLEAIEQNPTLLKTGEGLLKELRKKI